MHIDKSRVILIDIYMYMEDNICITIHEKSISISREIQLYVHFAICLNHNWVVQIDGVSRVSLNFCGMCQYCLHAYYLC